MAGAALSPDAWAATRYSFDLPAQSMRATLIALATQSNISVGGTDPVACAATAPPLRGRMTADAAIKQVFDGSRCVVRRLDAVTYRLELKPVPAPSVVTQSAEVRRPPIVLPPQPADIVVVSRRPLPINKIPRSISVIGAEAMRGNDLDLASLAPRVSGMAVTNLGPGRDKILLRGVSDSVLTGRTQSMVGLYLDDVPLTYNAPDPDLLLVDMARVEVMKGPQGALYGQGTMSGIVRLVTNKPQASRFESEISAGVGLTEGGHGSWRVTAMANLPLVADRLAVRGVLYHESSGGFIHADRPGPASPLVAATGASDVASNTTDRYGGRLGVLWQVSPHFTASATGMFQHLASSNSQYVYSRSADYNRSAQLAEPHDNEIEDLAMGLEGETDWGTLKLSLNHIHHNLRTGYDAQPLAFFVSEPNSGVLFFDESQSIHLETQEVSLVSPSDQPLRWLAGIFAAQGRERFAPNLTDAFTGKTLYKEDRLDRTEDMAAFGQIAWDPLPKWTLAVGLRAALARHKTASRINEVRLTNYAHAGDVFGKIRDNRVTHSLVARYRPSPSLMLYAQAANGFRTGGFNTTTLMQTIIPTRYAGDHLDSLEAGARWNSDDDRWQVSAAAYSIRWCDIQSDQLRSTGLPITINLGDGRNTGIEIEADWRLSSKATLRAAAQLNDPKLDRPDPLFTVAKGSGMPFIARTSMSVSADWSQSVFGQTLSSTAVLSYRSKSPLNYGPLSGVHMDAFSNLDLSSSLDLGKVRIALRVDNALATRGNSFAYGNPFTLDGANQITPLRPRTVWLAVSRRY